MSEEDKALWSSKKCPFGVGDENGKCCTSECAAWKEWDTRETVVTTTKCWENSKPGWFSDWKLVHEEPKGYYEIEESEGKRVWVNNENPRFLWEKKTSKVVGSVGGKCGRL